MFVLSVCLFISMCICEFVFECFVYLLMFQNQNVFDNVLRLKFKAEVKVKFDVSIKVNMLQCFSIKVKSKFQSITVNVSKST